MLQVLELFSLYKTLQIIILWDIIIITIDFSACLYESTKWSWLELEVYACLHYNWVDLSCLHEDVGGIFCMDIMKSMQVRN